MILPSFKLVQSFYATLMNEFVCPVLNLTISEMSRFWNKMDVKFTLYTVHWEMLYCIWDFLFLLFNPLSRNCLFFSAGFVIFYDLVLNLDQRVTACRLIVGLHGVSAQMGEPTLMPTVYTEPVTRGGAYGTSSTNAIIGARQPVPK